MYVDGDPLHCLPRGRGFGLRLRRRELLRPLHATHVGLWKTWQVVLGCDAYIRARGSAVGTQGSCVFETRGYGSFTGCRFVYTCGGVCVLGGVESAVCEGVSHVWR